MTDIFNEAIARQTAKGELFEFAEKMHSDGITYREFINPAIPENLRKFLSSLFDISLFPEEIYFLSTMPSEINFVSIFIISICSIVITILVSIFPALNAAKLDPIKALKYD